jgi:hypothetical protein
MYCAEGWRMRLYFASLAMNFVLPQNAQWKGQPIDHRVVYPRPSLAR